MNERDDEEQDRKKETEKERKSELGKRDISHYVFRKHTFILSHMYSHCADDKRLFKIFYLS